MSPAIGASWTDTLAAWLATYGLHSTLLLGVAWLVTRRTARPAVDEAIWRIATLAGLLTATLQQLWGAGQWAWPISAPGASLVETLASAPASASAPVQSIAWEAGGMLSGSTSTWWLAVVGVAASIGVARLVGAMRRLRHRLRDRVELVDGSLREELDALLDASEIDRRRPRLTLAPDLDVPVALGLLRPEIAVPRWAIEELDRAEQRSLLAHELAHLVRADTIWRPLASVLAALLPLQPLNHLAARRLESLSEDLADDWSRRRSAGSSLARCLTRAADHLLAGRALPVAAMASPTSPLGRRVQRLLAPPSSTGRSLPMAAVVVTVVLVALPMVLVAPGWATVPAPPSDPPAAPVVPEAPSRLEAGVAPPVPVAPSAPVLPTRLATQVVPTPPSAPRLAVPTVVPTPPVAPAAPTPSVAPTAPAAPTPAVVPEAPLAPAPAVAPAPPEAPAAPTPPEAPAPKAPDDAIDEGAGS